MGLSPKYLRGVGCKNGTLGDAADFTVMRFFGGALNNPDECVTMAFPGELWQHGRSRAWRVTTWLLQHPQDQQLLLKSPKHFRPKNCARCTPTGARRTIFPSGKFILLHNPLLREPLKLADIKPRLLGHWGTTPGLNFVYCISIA